MKNNTRRLPHPSFRRCAFISGDSSKHYSTSSSQSQIEHLIRSGYKHFISSGRPGLETDMAEAVIALRDAYSDILLEIVRVGSAASTDALATTQGLCEQADIVTDLKHKPLLCTRTTDLYMITNADMLLLLHDGSSTASEDSNYALGLGVPVYDIDHSLTIS